VKKRNTFLEQLRRRQEQASSPEPRLETPPPVEDMSDDQLDAALAKAKRDLLDAQHAELRERELARAQGQGAAVPSQGTETLADRLRGIQRGKRRTWR
jgi:hypothetical protein